MSLSVTKAEPLIVNLQEYTAVKTVLDTEAAKVFSLCSLVLSEGAVLH